MTKDLAVTIDALDAGTLRERGSLKWTMHPPDVLGAFVGEMDFGTAPVVTRALREAIDRGLFGYTPPWMVDGLRDACAQFMITHHGWPVSPEAIHAVPDVLRALEFTIEPQALRVLLPPGR